MIVRSFDYKRWADERTLSAVECIHQSTAANAYAFALQQLNHMVIVEELFKSRLMAEMAPHSDTNSETVPGLAELGSRLARSNAWYSSYVATLEHGAEIVKFSFADGKKGSMSVDEILFHILTHGSYHRGNIARTLDLAGVPHPVDGYGIYIHETEPQRR